MDKYAIERAIGSGAHATVYRGRFKKTNDSVAIKEIHPVKQKSIGNLTANFREIQTLQRLRVGKLENIIRLMEVVYESDTVFLVMEYCDDSLSDLLRVYRQSLADLPLALIKDIMHQLLTGMTHVHSEHILHRDLKPQNILIKYIGEHDYFTVKIADFGLAKCVTYPQAPETLHVASLWYRSPEVLIQSGYDVGIDLWAIGCIFGELVTGKPLVLENCEFGMLISIFQLLGTPTCNDWPHLNEYKNFSRHWPKWRRKDCLRSLETTLAPSLGEDGFALLLRFLEYDSNERIRCKDALQDSFFFNSGKGDDFH